MLDPATSQPKETPHAALTQYAHSLYERDERMRAILNTAADAIITINHRGLIENMNPATETMFGYTPNELVGQNIKLLMPAPYCDQHDGYIAHYLETREARIIGRGREVIGRRKDGSVFPISLAVSEVDHLNLFTGIVRDLTLLKELQRHILDIAAEEQRRIGLELHDGVAQELTGLSLYVRGLLNRLDQCLSSAETPGATPTNPEAALVEIREIAVTLGQRLQQAHQHVRELSHGMMPVQLNAQGLCAALEELTAAVSKSGMLSCAFEYPQPVPDLNNTTATHLYRIAQEAVNNSVRHSQATQIVIRMEPFDGHLLLEICDNGIGPASPPKSAGQRSGTGWHTMHYRASLIGAHLQIDAPPGGGTRVRCVLFLDRMAAVPSETAPGQTPAS